MFVDLSFLIPSKMRRQVLEYFVTQPDAQVYVNELARELKAAPQPVYRELINLENWGFLFSFKRGNQRVFRVNKRFVYFSVLQQIFAIRSRESCRTYEVIGQYSLSDMIREQRHKPVPEDLIPGLTSKRNRPRSFDEEKLLERLRHGNKTTK